MNNFTVCLNAVAPIFLVMAVGYAARYFHVLEERDLIKMNSVAFKVFVPVMMFNSLYNSDFSSTVRPQLIVFSLTGIVVLFFLSIAVSLIFCRDRSKQGVIIQGLFRSNFVIIGFPIVSAVISDENLGAVAIMLAIIVPTFNILAVFCLSIFGGEKLSLKEILKNIITNPLVIGSALGILAVALELRLPPPVEKAISDLGSIANPLLIFLLGAFFTFDGLRESLRYALAACIGRLVIIPAIMLPLAYKMGFRGLEFAVLIGVFASSTAVSSFTMAQQMGGDGKLAGNIVVLTSAACSFTLFAWLMLFKSLGTI